MTPEDLQTWLEQYGYLAVAVGAGVDHTGISWATVVAAVLAAQGVMDIRGVLACAAVGIMTADHLEYGVGRLLSRPLLRWMEASPRWGPSARRAEAEVQSRGGSVVLWGRFLPSVGKYAVLFAGIFGVGYRVFLTYELLGVALTVAVFGYVPYLIGPSALQALDYLNTGEKYALGGLAAVVVILLMLRARGRRKAGEGGNA